MKFFKNDSSFREQAESCINFFEELTKLLDEYETMWAGRPYYFIPSKDNTRFRLSDRYLVPAGTKKEVTYYSKPKWSFRISDHWNWYEADKKCNQQQYIQCFNVSLPMIPRRFVNPEERSTPCNAIQVAILTHDHLKKGHDGEAYHCVYGTYKDKTTHTWQWMEKTPEQVVEEYCLA